MANPLIHSKSSVKRWGGSVEDYLPIHDNNFFMFRFVS